MGHLLLVWFTALSVVTPPSSVAMSRTVCYNFQRGLCDRPNCNFSHEPVVRAGEQQPAGPVNPVAPPPMAGLAPRYDNSIPEPMAPRGNDGAGMCYDFQQGRCTRTHCKFSHGDQLPTRPSGGGFGGAGGFGGGGGSSMCYDFQQGRCTRTHCKFSHGDDAPAGGYAPRGRSPERRFSPGRPPMGGASSGVCFDFQKGTCTRTNCKFSHGGGGDSPRRGFSPSRFGNRSPPRDGGNVCRDFLKGACTRSNCRFSHSGAGGAPGGFSRSPPRGRSPPRFGGGRY